jgi:hypothetical protein
MKWLGWCKCMGICVLSGVRAAQTQCVKQLLVAQIGRGAASACFVLPDQAPITQTRPTNERSSLCGYCVLASGWLLTSALQFLARKACVRIRKPVFSKEGMCVYGSQPRLQYKPNPLSLFPFHASVCNRRVCAL